jgi:hypothetical protein
MNTAVRSLIGALTTVALIMALATTECVACGAEAKVSAGSAPCCNPEGQCKGAVGSARPCLKNHTQTPAIVEQTIHLVPAAGHVNFDTVQILVSQYQQAELPPTAQYSPPYLYLLHSAFLI